MNARLTFKFLSGVEANVGGALNLPPKRLRRSINNAFDSMEFLTFLTEFVNALVDEK